jgi:hypothetical protein
MRYRDLSRKPRVNPYAFCPYECLLKKRLIRIGRKKGQKTKNPGHIQSGFMRGLATSRKYFRNDGNPRGRVCDLTLNGAMRTNKKPHLSPSGVCVGICAAPPSPSSGPIRSHRGAPPAIQGVTRKRCRSRGELHHRRSMRLHSLTGCWKSPTGPHRLLNDQRTPVTTAKARGYSAATSKRAWHKNPICPLSA